MSCDDSSPALSTAKVAGDLSWFYDTCVNIIDNFTAEKAKSRSSTDKEPPVDPRPVIFVNQNDLKFNITKSAEFYDVVFDGIN